MPSGALSAGLLLVRSRGTLEHFLVHPGGPYFRGRDDGAWSLPKGLVGEGEDPLAAARRELREETGFAPPEGPYVELGEVRLRSGKRVVAWAVAGDVDPARLVSDTFELEWPPRSGRRASFPEVDRGGWFDARSAAKKLSAAQVPFLARAEAARAALGL